jgi:hypothetical protein
MDDGKTGAAGSHNQLAPTQTRAPAGAVNSEDDARRERPQAGRKRRQIGPKNRPKNWLQTRAAPVDLGLC